MNPPAPVDAVPPPKASKSGCLVSALLSVSSHAHAAAVVRAGECTDIFNTHSKASIHYLSSLQPKPPQSSIHLYMPCSNFVSPHRKCKCPPGIESHLQTKTPHGFMIILIFFRRFPLPARFTAVRESRTPKLRLGCGSSHGSMFIGPPQLLKSCASHMLCKYQDDRATDFGSKSCCTLSLL